MPISQEVTLNQSLTKSCAHRRMPSNACNVGCVLQRTATITATCDADDERSGRSPLSTRHSLMYTSSTFVGRAPRKRVSWPIMGVGRRPKPCSASPAFTRAAIPACISAWVDSMRWISISTGPMACTNNTRRLPPTNSSPCAKDRELSATRDGPAPEHADSQRQKLARRWN